MKIIRILILAIVALLSLAAGVAKLMRAPQEVAFFETLGLDLRLMTGLGIVQIAATVLVLMPRFRQVGGLLAALAFLTSALMIFKTGQTPFALISLLPVFLAIFVVVRGKGW